MAHRQRHREPVDWWGTIVYLLLVLLAAGIAALAALAVTWLCALVLTGHGFPIEPGWKNTVVKVLLYVIFFVVVAPGLLWATRYIRRTRGRIL